MIGQENIFASKQASIHPTNSQLIAGVTNGKVATFDLRRATSPLHEIAFNQKVNPIAAEYSPDGHKMLVTSQDLISSTATPQAIVVDLQHPTAYDDKQFSR